MDFSSSREAKVQGKTFKSFRRFRSYFLLSGTNAANLTIHLGSPLTGYVVLHLPHRIFLLCELIPRKGRIHRESLDSSTVLLTCRGFHVPCQQGFLRCFPKKTFLTVIAVVSLSILKHDRKISCPQRECKSFFKP